MLDGKSADFPSLICYVSTDWAVQSQQIIAGSVWQYQLQLLCSACLEWFGFHYSSENWRKMEKKHLYSQFDNTQVIS